MKSFLFIGLASGNTRISKTVTESGYGLAMPVKGGREPQLQYLKDWKKRHPHYHHDWYAEYKKPFTWRSIVAKFLGPIETYRDKRLAARSAR